VRPIFFTLCIVGLAFAGGARALDASTYAYPLRVSPNRRYLVDQNGRPFRIHGDAAWDLSTKVSLAELRSYLDNRQAKEFNTILVLTFTSVDYAAGNIDPAPRCKGAGGVLPFLKDVNGGTWAGAFGTADFSTPNDAYFAWIDTVITEAAWRGQLVLLTPMYLGWDNGVGDGWWRDLLQTKNTRGVAYAFGQYLGNRYKGFLNIMWVEGGDMLPAAGSEGEIRAHRIMEGIRAAGDTHLQTGHWVHENISTNQAAFAARMDVNSVYTHGPYPTLGPTYDLCRVAYGRSPTLPAYLIETTYEGEHNLSSAQFRELMWGAALSCIGGTIMGNWPLWGFASGWEAAEDGGGSKDMNRMWKLMESSAWTELVPSALAGIRKLITAGGGTYTSASSAGERGGDDWIVAAATLSGSQLVAFVPSTGTSARRFTVDMTAMSGPSVARWYNPTTGLFTTIASGIANTAPREFTTPGNNGANANDWVLVVNVSKREGT
jgi:hypothetical protein